MKNKFCLLLSLVALSPLSAMQSKNHQNNSLDNAVSAMLISAYLYGSYSLYRTECKREEARVKNNIHTGNTQAQDLGLVMKQVGQTCWAIGMWNAYKENGVAAPFVALAGIALDRAGSILYYRSSSKPQS